MKLEVDGSKGKTSKRASTSKTPASEDKHKRGRIMVASEVSKEEHLQQFEAGLKKESNIQKNEEEGLG